MTLLNVQKAQYNRVRILLILLLTVMAVSVFLPWMRRSPVYLDCHWNCFWTTYSGLQSVGVPVLVLSAACIIYIARTNGPNLRICTVSAMFGLATFIGTAIWSEADHSSQQLVGAGIAQGAAVALFLTALLVRIYLKAMKVPVVDPKPIVVATTNVTTGKLLSNQSDSTLLEELRRLGDLRDRGVINHDEFELMKKKFLETFSD